MAWFEYHHISKQRLQVVTRWLHPRPPQKKSFYQYEYLPIIYFIGVPCGSMGKRPSESQ